MPKHSSMSPLPNEIKGKRLTPKDRIPSPRLPWWISAGSRPSMFREEFELDEFARSA